MAHFAKLNQNNIVITVIVVHNSELLVDGVENEQKGVDFLNNLYKTSDVWKQTSYNSPQPYPSWTLNEDTCQWEAPVARPDDGKNYDWNEETQTWSSSI